MDPCQGNECPMMTQCCGPHKCCFILAKTVYFWGCLGFLVLMFFGLMACIILRRMQRQEPQYIILQADALPGLLEKAGLPSKGDVHVCPPPYKS
ncbi:hypothetical protein TrispH2_006254 [Trichoplax sp. H2]|nr:hypothetical protein TrispH2_006254 [Trichoplax sp. H2]|eukprot:RDD40751.1 hypothetical protein TrispH2_006254 [Trichoplax sp. H2]